MNIERIYLVATHHYSFRPGEPAEIIGVRMVTPGILSIRPCFMIMFADGKTDFVPVFAQAGSSEKNPNYEIITESDLMAGRIPQLTS